MDDFLIIGGGIAGLSAAAALSAAGTVTLVEAEESLGYHTSSRSAAVYIEGYGNAVVRALNSASRPQHEAAGVLSPRGLLMLARAQERAAFEDHVAEFGAEAIPLEAAEALFPILDRSTVALAARYDHALDIDTDRVLQTHARQARSQGATIVTGARVTGLRRTAQGWEASAGGRSLAAARLVNAAGAWADSLAGLAGIAPLGIQPYRRSMARLAAPGGADVRPWPVVQDVNEGWYAKPDAGAWIVSAAEEDPLPPQDAWADDMVIAEGLARYQDFVTVEVTRPLATWAGLRSFAPDRALVIGPDPVDPAFLWCAGQGGYGFQTAPAAAQLLADLALGRPPALAPEIVAALSPSRF